MFLKNASIFYGKELDFISTTNLRITNQKFNKIKNNLRRNSNEKTIDCEGFVLIPGLVNSHTHIGDSIGKDILLDSSVDNRVHPKIGVKSQILKKTEPAHLASFMRHTCNSMIQKGITTFIDFREGGYEGILLLKKALSFLPIRSVILGRIEYYQNRNQILQKLDLPKSKKVEIFNILKICDGIGVSGANENSDTVLKYYSKTKKIKAIHSAETKQSNNLSKKTLKKSETRRALLLRPHFLVHMTFASKNDLIVAAKKTRGIVVCPRANASLAEGIPDVNLMLKAGCNVAIGTDNVMINSPDIFREMDYLWKTTMGLTKKRIDPKEVLKMATVNAGKLLHKKIGLIEEGAMADGVFIDKHAIDLEPMHHPHASIVHRASQSTIKAVMIGGKIVHGKI